MSKLLCNVLTFSGEANAPLGCTSGPGYAKEWWCDVHTVGLFCKRTENGHRTNVADFLIAETQGMCGRPIYYLVYVYLPHGNWRV